MVNTDLIKEDENAIKELEKKIDARYREAEAAKDGGDMNTYAQILNELKPQQEELEEKRRVAQEHASSG